MRTKNTNSDRDNEIAIEPDCSLSTRFKKGEHYLIFLHAYHPKFALRIKGKRSPWYLKVKKLVSTKTQDNVECEGIAEELRP